MLRGSSINAFSAPAVRAAEDTAARIEELVPPTDVLTETLDHLVEGFGEHVAIVDENWTILSANEGWKQLARSSGFPQLSTGCDYRQFLQDFILKGHANAAAVLAGVNAIAAGESNSFTLSYRGLGPWQGRTLEIRINRLEIGGRSLATIARQDLTDKAELARLRGEFAESVMKTETEERRRLTRELHDSTAQLLVSASLLVATLKRKSDSSADIAIIDETNKLLGQAMREIRSIAYLAHAPAVEEMGLVRALEALAGGFGRRANLDVSFEAIGRPVPLSPAAESALYRIAQESLSNVQRHARAKHVTIAVICRKGMTHLFIADDGCGISDSTSRGGGRVGVGLVGMRSRVAELGGRLFVRRLVPGTGILASVPTAPRKS